MGEDMKSILGRFTIAMAILTSIVMAGPVSMAATQRPVDSAVESTFSCTLDSFTHVQGADWLRVHTSPGIGTPGVGQIKGGSGFCFSSGSGTHVDGKYWVYGYGYNGSTQLTGWVDGEFLVWP
jgi:hypothetical protein